MDLKTITAEKLVKLLNKETLDQLIKAKIKEMNIPWLYNIAKIFDHISTNGNKLNHKAMRYLYEFCDTFPEFIFKL